MKFYVLLSIIVFISFFSETKGDCDASEAIKCTNDYRDELKKVAGDQNKYCVSLHGYLDCLDWNDCLTEDMKHRINEAFNTVGIKCGAPTLTMSLAIVSTIFFVTLKNMF